MTNQFRFYTRLNLTELLGKKARNIRELLDGIKSCPGSSIYYHTHRFLQQHHFLSPEPPNDFAYWTSGVLQDDRLGEKLAAIDIVRFGSIRELREKLVSVIESGIAAGPSDRRAPEGEEFHFMKSVTFIIPTNHVVSTLEEFAQVIKKISIHSIYFHIFEARLRLEKGDNDFSFWLGTHLGEKELAAEIARLDPYTHTLEALRRRILALAEARINAVDK